MSDIPFRAEHAGSFQRPPAVLQARAALSDGRIGPEDLREVENAAIDEIIGRQQDAGLRAITDGEFRRGRFDIDFLERLEGVMAHLGETSGDPEENVPHLGLNEPVRHGEPIQGPDFDFLRERVSEFPKICIPAPTMFPVHKGTEGNWRHVYADREQFHDDLAAAYRAEIADLAERGCRYLQLDDTYLSGLWDPARRSALAEDGEDPDALAERYCRLLNDCLADRPAELKVALYLGREALPANPEEEEAVDPIAEILFNGVAVEGFLLEFEDRASGGLGLLRFMPSDKYAVLGLMNSRKPAIEPVDALRRRIDQAGDLIELDQCGLSHQGGFSPMAGDNDLSPDDQWRKLDRCVEVVLNVWGTI